MYHVVEIATHSPPHKKARAKVKSFDDAEYAVELITESWYCGEIRAGRLHIVDCDGSILLAPEDVAGIGLDTKWL